MQMPDVNVLIYAHRQEAHEHERYAKWLTELARGLEPFGLSTMVMQSFVRVVTTSKIFKAPTTAGQAFEFLGRLMETPGCRVIRPGPNHWPIFRGLCERGRLRGKIVADAAHAALAIESGCEWVTADTGFARFGPTLRWRHL
jgi:toxin-antitoxin system PIN domain toxin